ncbi:hypothetical protein A5881_001618 [Enterococcus termitis]
MRIFLDDVYDRRMSVLSYVDNQRKEVSLAEIGKATKLSKKTVSMIIKQFEQELDVSKEQFEVYYTNQTIQGVYANNIDIVSISNKHLKHSILYKMIKHLFLMDRIDAITFCDIEFISPATFSRHRRRLQKILNRCELSLTRTNEIEGDELRIRNFFFLFFSNALNSWTFDKHSYLEIENYLSDHIPEWDNLDSIKKEKLCLLLYICNIRISHKKNIEKSILSKLSEQFHDGFYTNLFFDYFHLHKNRTEQQSWDETSAVLFLIYKERLSHEESFEIEEYPKFFNETNFEFIKYSNLLTNQIIATFFQGATTPAIYWEIRKEIDMMHLLFETSFIDPRMFYYIYDENSFYYADAAEQKIQLGVQNLMHKLIEETEYGLFFKIIKKSINQETLIDYIYLVVYTILTKFLQMEFPKVKILIRNSKIFVEPILRQKISLIFSDKVEFVESQNAAPDIIVTDIQLQKVESEAKVIFISSFSNSFDFSLLLEEIEEKILMFYYERKGTMSNKEVTTPLIGGYEERKFCH